MTEEQAKKMLKSMRIMARVEFEVIGLRILIMFCFEFQLCLVYVQRYTKALSRTQRSSLVEKTRQKPPHIIQAMNRHYGEDPIHVGCGISIEKNDTPKVVSYIVCQRFFLSSHVNNFDCDAPPFSVKELKQHCMQNWNIDTN
ncbi:hypothetical protein MIMGU_mgv11b017117mg [Erythranthe guttata]|uniref:Uncharacterized protein n=1 Tax=Erythranthe guttata TaxID=4155 RepID=A0A022RIX6_ERYGU|nr:hypothetical protein MIMGU_mgv11b017117mg [Erythranthe guttata]